MKAFAKLLLAYVLGLLAIIGWATLFAATAHAQVTEAALPDATKVRLVERTSIMESRTCATWYYRIDTYGPWRTAYTAADALLLGEEKARALIAAWKRDDWQALADSRTHNIRGPTPLWRAVEPCVRDKLPKPPGPWVVTPTTYAATDTPVYAVTDGVRGTRAVPGVRGPRGADCACDVLAIATTSSTYCPLRADPVNAEQVTRCTEWKE